jgi:hypothetical protein
MANGHGGYRKPENPAPVSGPGSLSRRTDGGPQQVNASLPDARYGEQSDFQEIQSGAPMAAAPPVDSIDVGGGGGMNVSPPVPLTEPTLRPDEPISWGASFGPGPGPSRVRARRLSDTLQRLAQNDESGAFQDLYEIAVRKGF